MASGLSPVGVVGRGLVGSWPGAARPLALLRFFPVGVLAWLGRLLWAWLLQVGVGSVLQARDSGKRMTGDLARSFLARAKDKRGENVRFADGFGRWSVQKRTTGFSMKRIGLDNWYWQLVTTASAEVVRLIRGDDVGAADAPAQIRAALRCGSGRGCYCAIRMSKAGWVQCHLFNLNLHLNSWCNDTMQKLRLRCTRGLRCGSHLHPRIFFAGGIQDATLVLHCYPRVCLC